MNTDVLVPRSLVGVLPRWVAWVLIGCTLLPDALIFVAGSELAPQVSLLWILLLPLPTVLATLLLLRPLRRAPRGPIVDVGTTLGHPWVRTERHTAFTTRDEAQRAARSLASVQVEPGLDGVVLEVPGSAPAWPEATWTCVTAGIALTGAGLPAGVLGALYDHSIGELTAVEMVTIPLVTPIMLATVSLVLLLPWALVLTVLQRLSKPSSPVTVAVRGLVVTCGERRFTLGHPEQRIRLEPGRLVLEQPGARLEIPGRADHLLWLSTRLQQASERSGDPTSVPETLAALRAERGPER